MGSIGRIGMMGGLKRQEPSAGHDDVALRMEKETKELSFLDSEENKKQPASARRGASREMSADKAQAYQAQAKPRNAKVDEVAKMYEKQFLGEMMKAMRSTVSYSEKDKPSMAENIYKEQLDSQYVESWGDQGGLGLSNLIYDQMMDRYFDNVSLHTLKKEGPIKLTDRDVSHVSRVANAVEKSSQIPLKVELAPSKGQGDSQLKSPWQAEVVSNSRIGNQTAVTLSHDAGISSTFIFDGVASSGLSPGKQIAKDQPIGVLSPEINSFFWNLKSSNLDIDKGPGDDGTVAQR